MARNKMIIANGLQFGFNLGALFAGAWAARAEAAAGGRVNGAWYIALKHYLLLCPCLFRIGYRYGGKQRLRIRV